MQGSDFAFSENIGEARSLEKMTSLEAAVLLPSQYIQVLAGKSDAAVSKDELGFIIRRSDIHSVRAYVRESRALPVDYNKIVEWVGGTRKVCRAWNLQAFRRFINKLYSTLLHGRHWSVIQKS